MNTRTMNLRQGRAKARRGNTLIETALVLGILLNLAFGTVEFGHFFFIKNTLQGAAREGGRTAVVSGATNASVTAAVAAVMTANGIASNKYAVATTPADVAAAASGTQITVTVTCTWSTVGVRPLGMISGTKQVIGTAVMRKE